MNHDEVLKSKGADANEEDVRVWMRAEIAADPRFTMPGVVTQAAQLLGPSHRLVVEEALGPLFVEARNNTVCLSSDKR